MNKEWPMYIIFRILVYIHTICKVCYMKWLLGKQITNHGKYKGVIFCTIKATNVVNFFSCHVHVSIRFSYMNCNPYMYPRHIGLENMYGINVGCFISGKQQGKIA